MADDLSVPNLDGLVDRLLEGIFEPSKLKRLETALRNAHAEGAIVASGAEAAAVTQTTTGPDWFVEELEKIAGAVTAFVLSVFVEQAFDVNVDNTAFGRLGANSGRKAVAKAIADKMVVGLTGGSTSVEPSQQPAANYLSVVLGQTLETWALGEIVEVGSAFIPFIEKIEHVADLGDKVVAALGITESSARVLRPYIDNLVVEPLRRYIALTYRPALLGESLAVRQLHRGKWTRERLDQELGVLGWSNERIEAHVNAGERFLSLEDAEQLARGGGWSREDVVQHLRDQGYSERLAWATVEADRRKRLAAIWNRALSPAMNAYERGMLSEGDLKNLLVAIVDDPEERALVAEVAGVIRGVGARDFSEGDIEEAVRIGVLGMADYRDWLERAGYASDTALVKEIVLRTKIQTVRDTAAAREEALEERRQEQAARAAAALQRKAEIEQRRALERRGGEADLERAVIRGLIPIARLEEVLRAIYDPDTVDILVGLVEGERQRFLEQAAAAAAARQRAELRHIDVGALERAVLEGTLTVDEFRRHPVVTTFAPEDADILAATLAARLETRQAAEQQRREAALAASRRSIDLSRFEQLVRRGARSMGEYLSLLESLGFDEAARAALRELLELQIGDDQAARDERARRATADPVQGLTLEQIRRAVIRGNAAIGTFEQFLVDQRFTSDAQRVLLAELRDDLAEAEAARARRAQPDPSPQRARIPLSTLRQAARLGFIAPETYTSRLAADGWTTDEIEIELTLLFAEIGDIQAAREQRDEAEVVALERELSLAQVAGAVKAGAATLDDYLTRAIQIGLSLANAHVLRDVLEQELGAARAALERRAELLPVLEARGIRLAELEARVKGDELAIVGFIDELERAGVAADDAELLGALLFSQLPPAKPDAT